MISTGESVNTAKTVQNFGNRPYGIVFCARHAGPEPSQRNICAWGSVYRRVLQSYSRGTLVDSWLARGEHGI